MLEYRFTEENPIIQDKLLATRQKLVEVCAGGFIEKNQKFLFGKRSKDKDWAPELWDIVGGKSLDKENPLITLQREVFEETSARVMDAQLITEGSVSHSADGKILFKYHIYMITHYKGKIKNISPEHTELEWFSRRELDDLSLALPEYLFMIDEWIRQNGAM